jgi:hypothetical protein
VLSNLFKGLTTRFLLLAMLALVAVGRRRKLLRRRPRRVAGGRRSGICHPDHSAQPVRPHPLRRPRPRPLCLHPRPAGPAQPVLRRLRESVAGLLREGTSARRQGRAAVADRCDPAPRRSAPGHVQRAAALLLRRRQEPRPDPVPERRRVRRHLAGRTAEWAARSIADPFASRAEAVGHGEGSATQAPALLRTERPSPG